MWIYAIVNQKGGVSKTTTAVNLGAALAEAEKRVLLVDLDSQGSLSAAVGKAEAKMTICDVLRDPDKILGAIVPCAGKMQVVVASAQLANVFQEMDEMDEPAYRLTRALRLVDDCYDYCLIDCPPSLSHATTNALTAADVALVPLQTEFLALRGLADVQEITATVQEITNRNLRLRVVATMFDKRTIHAQDVLKSAREALPGLVYETAIPRTIRLAEAPATGQTILEFAPESNGAFAYRLLAQEILQEDSVYGAQRRHSSGDAKPAVASQPA